MDVIINLIQSNNDVFKAQEHSAALLHHFQQDVHDEIAQEKDATRELIPETKTEK